MTMWSQQHGLALFFSLILLATGLSSASADEAAPYCPPQSELLDKHRYLRALSMDLTGKPASLEEHNTLATLDELPTEWIDQMLSSPAFAEQVGRFHRNLLWNRVSQTKLVHDKALLRNSFYSFGAAPALYNPLRAGLLRGKVGVPCLNKEAAFDPLTNAIVFEDDPATNTQREGWVVVSPYYAPESTVKVCAADAQTTLFSADGTSCKGLNGLARKDCGCGPNLNWCVRPSDELIIRKSLGKAVDLRVEQLISDNEPYTHLFLNNVAHFNGHLVHYWRHLAQRFDTIFVDPVPVPLELLPDDLSLANPEEWAPIELSPEHAGLLTSPAYLIRHTTGRRRALRFHEGLICQPFVPPSQGLEFNENKAPEPDLRKKDGCKFCHAIMEPSSQHWGRWAEFGTAYLSPKTHPPCRADCQSCGLTGNCSIDCKKNYVTSGVLSKELKFMGWLKPYQFMIPDDILNEIQAKEVETKVQCDPALVAKVPLDHIEMGPKVLVQQTIVDGRLARCGARNVYHWLMGRKPGPLEAAWIDALATQFSATQFNFKTLVKSIVTHSYYRRVR